MSEPDDPIFPIHQRILAALPQTQCGRCGFDDCADYARAVGQGRADINRCAPGGAEGLERLAALTGRPVVPIAGDCGPIGPRSVVFVEETWCVGCTLCQKVCPVDAIVGATKLMHTVIESLCTGCMRCVPACPVDCILTQNVSGTSTGWQAWGQEQADQARNRYDLHRDRCRRDASCQERSTACASADADAVRWVAEEAQGEIEGDERETA